MMSVLCRDAAHDLALRTQQLTRAFAQCCLKGCNLGIQLRMSRLQVGLLGF